MHDHRHPSFDRFCPLYSVFDLAPEVDSADIRAIFDYNTLNSQLRSQLLLGWTPSPGTAFYAGYNDDVNYNFQNPITGQYFPGFRRNSRVFFVKMSYLFRKSFG